MKVKVYPNRFYLCAECGAGLMVDPTGWEDTFELVGHRENCEHFGKAATLRMVPDIVELKEIHAD